MINPLTEDLSLLSDQELDEKLSDLTKKYHISYRLGKPQLLTQLENTINIYKEERSIRYHKQKLKDNDQDLDDLINVE